jgi:uncharacterized protein (DUF1697 family)
MARLKSLFESLGFAPARTHLNSGNVIFAAEGKAGTLARLIGDAIKAEFGFRPAVLLRSAAELKRVVAKNPFGDTAARDPSHLLVMALEENRGRERRPHSRRRIPVRSRSRSLARMSTYLSERHRALEADQRPA